MKSRSFADALSFKLIAFALGSFYAGIAGALLAYFNQFVNPEQFGLLLMDCNAFGGMIAAERFYADISNQLAALDVTFHAGIAAWKDWMLTPDDLMHAANDALQAARSLGPNRIEMHHR